MTVDVSVRSISALLLVSVSLLGLPEGAPAQSVVAPQKTDPTFAERRVRLAAEFDRNRINLHVLRAALAIVRREEVHATMQARWAAAFVARPGKVLSPLAPKPDIVEPDVGSVGARIIALDAPSQMPSDGTPGPRQGDSSAARMLSSSSGPGTGCGELR